MAGQNRTDLSNLPIILSGASKVREQEIILQEATRSVPLKQNTLMCKIAASSKWTPVTSATVTATDGKAMRMGIYLGDDIAAATLVAGDTTGMILVGDAIVDGSLIVFGKGPTDVLIAQALTTAVGGAVIMTGTIQDLLELFGIFAAATLSIDGYEN